MSEGQKFEIPPKSHEPQSVETLLEKGEIKSAKELEGYWGMQLVEIKDDGDAFFRPDKETDFLFEEMKMEVRRSDLELMAYKVDQILGFNLVPAVVNRTMRDMKGSLQSRIKNPHTDKEWDTKIKPEELTRAAIFDHLLDVKDRHSGNFIIDADTNKLWLIDHDFFMFFMEDEFVDETRMLMTEKAQDKGMVTLGETEITSLERFISHEEYLTTGTKSEIVEIINKAVVRAKILLEKGQIPSTNT